LLYQNILEQLGAQLGAFCSRLEHRADREGMIPVQDKANYYD